MDDKRRKGWERKNGVGQGEAEQDGI